MLHPAHHGTQFGTSAAAWPPAVASMLALALVAPVAGVQRWWARAVSFSCRHFARPDYLLGNQPANKIATVHRFGLKRPLSTVTSATLGL